MSETAGGAGLDGGRAQAVRRATCEFVFAAARSDGLPPVGAPEIAFAGRSNVGKSSLINALTGRLSLARTSRTPGRTQELIFFDLDGRARLVDMPGYGYAAVAKAKSAAWGDARARLSARPPLASARVRARRRPPWTEGDAIMRRCALSTPPRSPTRSC